MLFVEIPTQDTDVLFFKNSERGLYCLRKYEPGLDKNQVQIMCQLIRLPFTEFNHLYEENRLTPEAYAFSIKNFLEAQDKLVQEAKKNPSLANKQLLDITYDVFESLVLNKYNVKDIDELFDSVVESGLLSQKSYSDPEFRAIMRLQEYRGKDLTEKDFDEFDRLLATQSSS